MALKHISENADNLQKSTQNYIEQNFEYYKLSAFKKLTKGTSSIILFIIIGAVLFGAVLLLTFSLALFIGAWLDNIALGFLILGVSYFIAAIIAYYSFRKTIERKVLRRASEVFFDGD